MSDGSRSKELNAPVDLAKNNAEAERRGGGIVDKALAVAIKHASRLNHIFGKPERSESSRQSRRRLLTGLGATAALTAIDATTGGNIIGAAVRLLPESKAAAQVLDESVSSDAVILDVDPAQPVSQEFSAQLSDPPEVVASTHTLSPVVQEERSEPKPVSPSKPEPKSDKESRPPQVAEKPKEEKGTVSVESFVDSTELKKSAEFRKIIDEFVDIYTFKAEIDGKKFKVPLPFAEVGEGYGFPTTPYPDGGIPSKMRPEMAQDRFQKAIESGDFVSVFHKKLAEYNSIDPKKLSPNDKLAYNNLGEDKSLSSGEKYAFYNSLRDLGIYGDCNGTAFNALSFVYDRLKGKRGEFDALTKKIFPDLARFPHPVVGFNIDRFGNDKWATEIELPKVKDFNAGDIIALGKEQHTMLVVGWDPEKNALVLMQNTDETRKVQGLDIIHVYITNAQSTIQEQKWEVALADDTTIAGQRGGDRWQSRLDEPIGGSGKQYKVFRNLELQKEMDRSITSG